MNAIVNADDFGLNQSVNRAIAESFRNGLCSNTTLIVNMPYADEAVEIAYKEGFSDRVGLHLNLTEGVPLTEPIRRMPAFCDDHGYFTKRFHKNLTSRLWFDKTTIDAVRVEVEAQIRKYMKYRLDLMHIDSHHHVHTDLAVWRVIEPLMRTYGFKSIRISRNMFSMWGSPQSIAKALYKTHFNRKLKTVVPFTTHFFGSMQDFLAFEHVVMKRPGTLTEIMVHPVYREDVLFDGSKLFQSLNDFDVNLISYRGLCL
jgi:predicted glycoside hydrolase/deacetylase ChbG (UPF0249 family)